MSFGWRETANRVILPFAPPAPLRIAPLCSQASSLLRPSLTSHARSSAATAPRLPAAGYDGFPSPARHETSRFPSKERLHMPGSLTTPGRPGARDDAPGCVAFRHLHGVGTQNRNLSRLNGWPMRPPVNASPKPSRATAHDSGPMRFATPSSQGTCTLYSLPVSRRTQMFSGLPLKADVRSAR